MTLKILRFLFACFLGLVGCDVLLGAETGFLSRTHRGDSGESRYVVFVPQHVSDEESLPVILFLHGAGQRGSDGRSQLDAGLASAIRARQATFPFLAVFPQCDDRQVSVRHAWSPNHRCGQRALAILQEVINHYQADEDRVYLIGTSMGGFGVWSQAAADPQRWAAIAPISGGGSPELAARLTDLPIWCFHGLEDHVVPANESRAIIEAVREAGGRPRYSELAGVGHNAEDTALHLNSFYDWLLLHKRGVPPTATGESPVDLVPETIPVEDPDRPFVAGLEISDAATLHLGQETLKTLGHSLPRMPAADMLRGTIPDRKMTTQTQVGPMSIHFSGIHYEGKLGRAQLVPQTDGTLAVTLRAREVNIHIDHTSVRGSGRSANCGPMTIQLGNRRDLKIHCVIRPEIEHQKLKLHLQDTEFTILTDNWRVGSPEWISTSGAGMTRERVTSGLRQGFFRDKKDIESQFINALPSALDKVTESMPFQRAEEVIRAMWPMPVYAPRLKAWPSSVAINENGATLGIGISVAALSEEEARKGPRQVSMQPATNQAATGSNLAVSFHTSLVEPISQQLIDSGVARALVVDLPLKSLQPLADAKALSKLVPDLAHHENVQLRSELVMSGPLRLKPGPENVDNSLSFQLNKIICEISLSGGTSLSPATPYLKIETNIRQTASIAFEQPTLDTRAVALQWKDLPEVEVTANFASGYQPQAPEIDTDGIREIFSSAWSEWIATGPLTSARIEDLALGADRLRMNAVEWDGQQLTAQFEAAGIQITNRTDEIVSYQTKGPYSRWSKPVESSPDKTLRFAVSYPFQCRFESGGETTDYILKVGRRYEFRTKDSDQLELVALPDKPAAREQDTDLSVVK